MRFIIETISGRKGIKNFENINEYVDFMTKNSNKIKNIFEADMPYDDKPVKLSDVTTSDGWKQIDSSAFGKINSKAEKGDCILPTKSKSVFKDEAKFEPTKSSEKDDTQSSNVKVKSQTNSESKSETEKEVEKDLPKFKYEDDEKSDDKEDKSKDKKINEAVETQPDMFDNEYDTNYVDGVQTYTFHEINDFMSQIAPNLSYTNDDEQNGKVYLGYWGNNLSFNEYKRIAQEIKNKFNGNVQAHLARAQYSPEQKTLYISYTPTPDDEELNESLDSNQLNEYVDEYFVYLFMIAYGKTNENNQSFKQIINYLKHEDKKFIKIHERLLEFINNNLRKYPSSILVDAVIRLAYGLGVSDTILNKAKQIFEKEELNNNSSNFDDEIKEALRIAGVELNEYYNQADDELDDGQDIDDEKVIDSIKQMMKDKNISEEEAVQEYINFSGMDENIVQDIWNDYKSYSEQANNEEDGEIEEKTGKEKLFEEDPLDESPMSDEEFDSLEDGDKVNWDLSKYNSNYTVRKNGDNLDLIGDNGQGNWLNQNSPSDRDYIKKRFSKGEKEMPDENSLEYAQDQVRAWENEKEMAEYDDFAYTNGNMDKIERNLSYWKNRVELLSNNSELSESEDETLEETKPARYNQHLGKDKSFANISASRSNDEFEKPGMEKEKQKQSEENNKKPNN